MRGENKWSQFFWHVLGFTLTCSVQTSFPPFAPKESFPDSQRDGNKEDGGSVTPLCSSTISGRSKCPLYGQKATTCVPVKGWDGQDFSAFINFLTFISAPGSSY